MEKADARCSVSAVAPFPAFVDKGAFRFFSGLAAMGAGAGVEGGSTLVELAEAPFRNQANAIYDTMEASLADAGGLASVLRQHMYQRDKRRFPVLEGVRQEREVAAAAPSSGLGLSWLRDDSVTYELDAIALNPSGLERLGLRAAIEAPGVGGAAALYSQAVAAGPYVFTAGMLALTSDRSRALMSFEEIPEEGRWLQRNRSHPDYRMGPVVAQTWILYDRFKTFLDAHGLGLENVCAATVFIHDEGDFADALRVHQHWFGSQGPALQVIQVDEVGHKGTVIEIEITATRGRVERTAFVQDGFEVPAVVRAGELAFASDHLPLAPDGRLLQSEGVEAYLKRESGLAQIRDRVAPAQLHLAAQTWMALKNMSDSMERAGIDPNQLGQVLVRFASSSSDRVPWLDGMLRSIFSDIARAVILLRVPAVPQSRHARVAVAGVCGLGDK